MITEFVLPKLYQAIGLISILIPVIKKCNSAQWAKTIGGAAIFILTVKNL